jgi:hypothetical protein
MPSANQVLTWGVIILLILIFGYYYLVRPVISDISGDSDDFVSKNMVSRK